MQRLACIMFFSSLVLFCSINCKLGLKKQFNQKVVNGDFENGANGWTSNDIEVLTASTYNSNWDSHEGNVSELDAWKGNTEISQTFDLYQGTYTLRFQAAARQGVALASNKLIVYFDDAVILSYAPTDYLVKKFKIVVTAVFGKNTLKFKGDGTNDTLGITVDNITLRAKAIEFIVDGTFENNGTGWVSADKEVLDGSNYSSNWKSGKVTELDAWVGNTIMKETFKVDIAATFVLRFDYNARSGVALDSNKFSVYFDGKVILNITPGDYNNHSVTLYLNGSAGDNTIEFHGEGKSDTLGMTIDNVSVTSYAPEEIVNGDFEAGSKGWTSSDIEIGSGSIYSDYFSTNVSELDAWKGNTSISQSFDSDDDDDFYVSFDGAARKGVDLSSCQMQLYFNDILIADIHPGNYLLVHYIFYVKVKEGTNTIKIVGTGKSDTLGFIIDNISCRKKHDTTGSEYIINGGFENGTTGWTSNDIEIGNGSVYSSQMNTGNVSELDAWKGNTIITNKVTIDAEGYFELKFDGAGRNGVALASNKAIVLIDDIVVLSISPNDWDKHSFFIPYYLTVGVHSISFKGDGTNDTVGYIIDNASLKRLF